MIELHQDAERAAEIAHDFTGTLDTSPGDYLGVRGDFRVWIFQFSEGQPMAVAWFAAVRDETLIVLCGGAKNFLGQQKAAENSGWTPSSPKGLAQIVKHLRKKDPTELLSYSADPVQQRAMAEAAAEITVGLPDQALSFDEPLDVFMRCYVDLEEPVTGIAFKGRSTFSRVVVGAPIWVREFSDLALPGEK